jgi:xanthine dehydrogenase accessory factor
MCLVTLVGIDGSAPRPLGSQIAVSEIGEALGYITGGCAEAAIIAEAQDCIAKGENRLLRYGEGSPYKDIALPCGSGIDVYFDTGIQTAQIEAILEQLSKRKSVSLLTNIAAHLTEVGEYENPLPQLNNNDFTKPYTPTFKLHIAGKGPVVPALARLASQSGFIVEAASPEAETLQKIPDDIDVRKHLKSPESYAPALLDPWCAAVTLFHDHEWEPPILTHFLASPCFYVGALGSRNTHQTRLDILEGQGVSTDQLARLRGPVGLDIQASTPTEVAISILAEIIQTHRTKERGPARWVR